MNEKLYEIIDGNGSFAFYKGEEHFDKDFSGREFRLIATECSLPYAGYARAGHIKNDTIMQAVDNGEIVFTKLEFVKRARAYCPYCGKAT